MTLDVSSTIVDRRLVTVIVHSMEVCGGGGYFMVSGPFHKSSSIYNYRL